MNFSGPPKVSLLAAALHRAGDFSKGILRLEATASSLTLDARAYAQVCGFTAADPLPLCYLDVACRGLQFALLTSPAFPLKLLGLVHVSQRLERRRAIFAGEALRARVSVEGHRIVRKGAEFELHTEVSAGPAVVWSGVSVLLSQAIQGDGVKRAPPPEPTFAVERASTWSLPADLGRRYAKVSHDYNPIHLSALSAKLFGFPRALVHGWWSLARCLAELDAALPEACVVEAAFRKPIFLPSTVGFEAGHGADGLHFGLRRADGAVALTGRCRGIVA